MNKHIYTAILTEYNGEREYDIPLAIEANNIKEAKVIADAIAQHWYEDAFQTESGLYSDGEVCWEIEDVRERYDTWVYTDAEHTKIMTIQYEKRE